ncbi:YrzQ family protein [Ectobacillus sp. sgz5001026]
MNMRNSIMAFGLGAAAYHYVRKNNVMSARNMKKAKKLVKSYF